MASRTLPSIEELERFRAETEASMLDACVVLRQSVVGVDAATGMPTQAWTPVTPEVPCDFTVRSRRETRGDAQIVVTSTSCRLPLRISLTSLDRVRMTRKLRLPLAVPETYEISELKAGGLEWILDLKRAAETLEP